MDNLNYYAAQVLDGIAYGSIYGIFALSLVLLYRANKLFNFAQTEIATLFVMIGIVLLKHFNYGVTVLLLALMSFGGGILLHFGIMRFVTERKKALHSSESLLTIGLFTILTSITSYLFGEEPFPFPAPLGTENFKILGVGVSYHSLVILVVSMVFMVLIHQFYKRTLIGLVFEAVSENATAARLRGIHVSNVLALAWGITSLIATLGAILIAPVIFVTPNMLTNIFIYSLIAVVIGGLESPGGAMVGGIIVGVVENVASNIEGIGAELKFVVVALLLLVTLIVRPRGLWGRAEVRRI